MATFPHTHSSDHFSPCDSSLLLQLKSRIDLVDDGAAFPMAGAPRTGSIAGMQYLQLDEAICVAYASGDLMLCTLDGADVSIFWALLVKRFTAPSALPG